MFYFSFKSLFVFHARDRVAFLRGDRLIKFLLTMALAMALSACITTKRGESRDSLELAQTALEKVESVGAVWMLVDPATGDQPLGLDELLTIAQEKFKQRDYLESKRVADRIVQAARLGLRQMRDQRDAGPIYPE